MFNGTNATGIIFLSLSLAVGAVLASDVLKYGATFESAAGGKTNDFAYAVGDWIGNVFPPPIHPYYSYHANVGTYRGESNGESYGWFAGCEDDESEIIARTDAAGGQALRLNTDLGTLTNKFQQAVANELTTAITNGGGAYIEVEAKFVPSDVCDVGVWDGIGGYRRATSALKLKDIGGYDPIRPPSTFVPASSTSPLFAIYAFCEDNDEHNPTNLVVFHGGMDANGGITYTNEVFPSVTIDTESYTKLRVEMRQLWDPLNPESKYNAFSVRVDDGAPLSSVTALDARFGGTATGTWFMTVEDRSLQADQLLSSLNFKGCGEIDDIKVGVMEGGSPPPCAPDGNEITDENILGWLARYGANQSDIDKLTMGKFNEEFLLNLDLTKNCVAVVKMTSIRIEGDTVTVGVRLVRTEDGMDVGTRAINGRLKLMGGASLSEGAFAVLGEADIGNADFATGNVAGIEYELPQRNRPAFFKVVIGDPE